MKLLHVRLQGVTDVLLDDTLLLDEDGLGLFGGQAPLAGSRHQLPEVLLRQFPDLVDAHVAASFALAALQAQFEEFRLLL